MNFALGLCTMLCFYTSQALETVQDDDVLNLIPTETYVIVLFSTSNCELCDNFENALNNLEEEFTKTLNGPIVKVINSQLTRLYSPTKEPVLVFFRHGIPLLYNDVPAEDLIHHTFITNKEPVVKELTDDTFEHLTQAATGATTGDWFVMFYSPECVDCHRLQARWEAVGAQIKSRVNVARVNKATQGVQTAARFRVTQVPSFILFKQGKLYRYQIQKYDIASFTSFAQDWYKNMKPERVTLPKSPFDQLIEDIVVGLHENPAVWKISLLISLVGLVLFVVIKRKQQRVKKPKVASKSKKEGKDK